LKNERKLIKPPEGNRKEETTSDEKEHEKAGQERK
jgi:hypothetical protein